MTPATASPGERCPVDRRPQPRAPAFILFVPGKETDSSVLIHQLILDSGAFFIPGWTDIIFSQQIIEGFFNDIVGLLSFLDCQNFNFFHQVTIESHCVLGAFLFLHSITSRLITLLINDSDHPFA